MITVVDFGTGLGLGLLALNDPESFSNIHIEDAELKKLINTSVSISQRIGIDEQERYPYDLQWYRACLLPGYRKNRRSFERTATKLITGAKIPFVHGNFLHRKVLKAMPSHSADVVWTSNVLYTVGATKEAALTNIKSGVKYVAKPEAVYIDADYRDWKDFSAPDNPYVYTARFLSDWKHPLEVLEAPPMETGIPKDAVLCLAKGKDYERFKEKLHPQTNPSRPG